MGPFEMVVWIVVICTASTLIGTYIRARYGKQGKGGQPAHDWSDWDWGMGGAHHSRTELQPYLEKIDALEERIRVLERIVTDRSDRLSREIDELR